MKYWQMCPVCNGVGQVSGGYYLRAGDCNHSVSDRAMEMCQTCQGKGIIETPDDAVEPLIKERSEE